jgi:hypothetical protein
MTEENSVTAQIIEITDIVPGQQYTIPPGSVLKVTYEYENGVKCVFLAGGNPNANLDVHAVFTTSRPELRIDHGWSYMAVVLPPGVPPPPPPPSGSGRARTERVSATANGTRFFVQEINGTDRAVLLSEPGGSPGVVGVVLDGNEGGAHNLTTALTYYEFLPQQTSFNSAMTVDPDSEVGELVDYIEDIASQAGIS